MKDELHETSALRGGSGYPIHEIADKAVTHASALLDADGASVTEVVAGEYVYVAAVGAAEALLGRVVSLDGSFTGRVVESRRARLFGSTEDLPRASRLRATHDAIQSGIISPIVVGERVVGTVGVASSIPGRYGDDDLETMRRLSSFLAEELVRRQAKASDADRDGSVDRWARYERLGALLTSRMWLRLDALHERLEEVLARTDGGPLVGELTAASIALENVLSDVRAARRGRGLTRQQRDATDPSDQADQDVTSGDVAVPTSRNVRDEIERALAFVAPEIDTATQLDVTLPNPGLRVAAWPNQLAELVVHMIFTVLERIEESPDGSPDIQLYAGHSVGELVVEVGRSDGHAPTSPMDEHIDPFADGASSRDVSLAIARRNAEAMGGSLSQLGAIVRVRLPLHSDSRELPAIEVVPPS